MNDIKILMGIIKNDCNNIDCYRCPLNKKTSTIAHCYPWSRPNAKKELEKYTQEEIFEALL